MLLLDYMLSPEGQKILAEAEYFPVRPDVPPLERLAGIVPKTAGYTENYIAPQKLKEYIDSTDQIFQNLFR
jgi:ABC-type Fe3+ transport system substrate-binding protein